MASIADLYNREHTLETHDTDRSVIEMEVTLSCCFFSYTYAIHGFASHNSVCILNNSISNLFIYHRNIFPLFSATVAGVFMELEEVINDEITRHESDKTQTAYITRIKEMNDFVNTAR